MAPFWLLAAHASCHGTACYSCSTTARTLRMRRHCATHCSCMRLDPGCLLRRWIEMNALKEVSAPVAAIIYSAEPLWGAGLAWGILGERCALPPSPLQTLARIKSHSVPVEGHLAAQMSVDAVMHLPCIAAACFSCASLLAACVMLGCQHGTAASAVSACASGCFRKGTHRLYILMQVGSAGVGWGCADCGFQPWGAVWWQRLREGSQEAQERLMTAGLC